MVPPPTASARGAEAAEATDPTDPAASIGTLCAVALPLLFFIAALPPFSYYGEQARLLDEAVGLGHAATPVSSLLAAIVARVPLGPLSLRVGLSVALAAAIASGALFRALLHLLRALGLWRDEVSAPLCLGACCIAFGNEPMWSLVLRGSPHVIGIALSCLVLQRSVSIDGQRPSLDRGRWLGVGLFMGLLLSHDLAWALSLLPCLWLIARDHRPSTACLLALGVGCTPMLYPALRGLANTTPMPTSLADAAMAPFQQALAFGAAVAAAASMRRPPMRKHAALLLTLLGVPMLLGMLTAASPALTAVAPGLGLMLASGLCALGMGALLSGPVDDHDGARPRLPMMVAIAAMMLGVAQLRQASTARALTSFDTSDVLQQHAADHLPPRTVVLWPTARGYASAAGHHRETGARPDVVHVPMSHARDPDASEQLARKTPALRGLLRDQLLQGRLRSSALQTLAIRTPVAIDAPASDLPELCESLLPSGSLLRVTAEGATRRDQRMAAEGQADYYARLYENIELQRLDAPSRRRLLRLHRRDALYYMHFGDRAAARDALLLSQRLSPGSTDIAHMLQVLGEPDGPDWNKPVEIAPLVAPESEH